MQRPFPIIVVLIAISCGTLFFRLGALPLSGSDEPRYARIAQEMQEDGRWVTPTLEGKPWLEKPPLYYWISKPFFSIVGAHETAARLGPAFCALITALAVCWIGFVLFSPRAGLLGGSILLTSIGFVGFGRSASTDSPFTCCFTLAMAFFAAAAAARPAALKYFNGLLGYAFLGLAVLGKGPVAMVLAAGIGLMFWFFAEQEPATRRWWIFFPGLLVTGAVSAPWFWLVFRQNGFSFVLTFFVNQNLARYVTAIHHHSQPFYYFLPVLLALFFPWSGWLPLLIPKAETLRDWRHWNKRVLFLACWFAFPMLFFSLSEAKLAGYILPSIPPLALLLGVRVSQFGKEQGAGALRASMWLYLVFSMGMAAAAPFVFQRRYGNLKTGLILSAVIAGPAIIAFWRGMAHTVAGALKSTVVQGVLVVVAVAQFAFPVLGAYLSTRDIAHRALELRKAEEPIVTYRFFEHSLHYYTGYHIADDLKDPQSLIRAAQTRPSLLIVTNARGMKELANLSKTPLNLLATQGDLRLLRITEYGLTGRYIQP